jgi:hypothetical protein
MPDNFSLKLCWPILHSCFHFCSITCPHFVHFVQPLPSLLKMYWQYTQNKVDFFEGNMYHHAKSHSLCLVTVIRVIQFVIADFYNDTSNCACYW